MDRIEFYFRVWIPSVDRDPPEFEVWYQGFEPVGIQGDGRQKVTFSEIINEAMQMEDLQELFSLDPNKNWQVIGKAAISRSMDYFNGGYEQDLDLLEFSSEEFGRLKCKTQEG